MRTRQIPRGARHLRNFGELESYLTDFVGGLYPFLWIVGRPGVAKTESVRTAIRGRAAYYRKAGQLTPAEFFRDCYHHRGQPIILDDAEHLLDSTIGAKLISALGETTPAKQMSYSTTSRVLGDVPPVFFTTSPLCIIANRGTTYVDIQSRAITLYFDPSNLEIHRAVARWFWDQEIHDWFGQHLSRLPPLDARWYVIADRDKRAGRDWRQIILTTHTPSRAWVIVQDLELDSAYPTREDKAQRFVELMGDARGASRASYFRLHRRLQEANCLATNRADTIFLRHTRPPSAPGELELELPPPVVAEEETRPIDIPPREEITRRIRVEPPPTETAQGEIRDDSLSWEQREED